MEQQTTKLTVNKPQIDRSVGEVEDKENVKKVIKQVGLPIDRKLKIPKKQIMHNQRHMLDSPAQIQRVSKMYQENSNFLSPQVEPRNSPLIKFESPLKETINEIGENHIPSEVKMLS